MKLTPKIQKAINFACRLHLEQIRKGDDNLPYISHPFSVGWILTEYSNDEDIIVSGLLHDVLEDVPNYGRDKLKRDFGKKIYKIVKEVSEEKSPKFSRNKEKATWQKRKEKYLEHLKRASFEAMMVCAADKIHNLMSLIEAYKKQENKIEKKFNAPLNKKLWFYGEVLKILQGRLKNEILKELEKIYLGARNLIKLNKKSQN